MKYRAFRTIAFFAAFFVGIIAAALFWQSEPPQMESQTPLAVESKRLPPTEEVELNYDKARYDEINSVIESIIENKMQENFSLVPFDEVSDSLSLEGVPWDDGCINCDFFEEKRIYHFRGFYLILNVAQRIPGDPPMYSSDDLKQKGVPYLYHFHPALHIDGLNDPKERMRVRRQMIHEEAEKINQEMKREKKNSQKK
jgi:hypothetical protein